MYLKMNEGSQRWFDGILGVKKKIDPREIVVN